MYYRLYFLLPDETHAQRAMDSLKQAGVKPTMMHAHQRNVPDAADESDTAPWQRVKRAEKMEAWAWRADLAIFFLALLGLVVSLWMGSTWFSIGFITLMLISFIAGNLFAGWVPRVHLREFEHALSHGEVLLMVDVKHDRVAEIENLVHSKHPAAVAGGSSWTLPSMGT